MTGQLHEIPPEHSRRARTEVAMAQAIAQVMEMIDSGRATGLALVVNTPDGTMTLGPMGDGQGIVDSMRRLALAADMRIIDGWKTDKAPPSPPTDPVSMPIPGVMCVHCNQRTPRGFPFPGPCNDPDGHKIASET